MVLTGIIYGIKPYGASAMGWGNPFVVTMLVGGLAVLGLFVVIERRVDQPMLDLELFSVRPFTMGNIAALLASTGRGGFQFMLIIWLQGIWLPLHWFDFARTPLWAGIYLMPLTAGFLAAGPLSGWLSDHFGARPFATGGMLLAAASFLGMMALPANFSYPVFAAMLLVNGMAFGMFASPNMASVMNSVPARHRGAASGTLATFQNAGFPLSIGLFFSLMVVGLQGSVPTPCSSALRHTACPSARPRPCRSSLRSATCSLPSSDTTPWAPCWDRASCVRSRPGRPPTSPAGRSSPSSSRARSGTAWSWSWRSPRSCASSLPPPRGCVAASSCTRRRGRISRWPDRIGKTARRRPQEATGTVLGRGEQPVPASTARGRWNAMGEIWLGVLLVLGVDLLLIGFVGGTVYLFTWADERRRRRRARAFADAVARRDFERAEAAAARAFVATDSSTCPAATWPPTRLPD